MRHLAAWVGILLLAPAVAAALGPLPELTPARALPPDPRALAQVADDPAHPVQAPLLMLGAAAGLDGHYARAPAPPPLARAVLDLYISQDLPLDPLLIADVEASAAQVPPAAAAPFAALVAATARATPAAEEATGGAAVNQQQLLDAALDIAAAIEYAMSAEDVPWPPGGWTDPLGWTRLGSPGPDTYTRFHFVSLDPQGDDLYLNNGGASFACCGASRAAVALDLAGDDNWTHCTTTGCYAGIQYGAADFGIGLAVDADGEDVRSPRAGSLGFAFTGLGAFLDLGEDADVLDSYVTDIAGASSDEALGLYFDDGGNDSYALRNIGLGSALWQGVALFLDNDGADDYSKVPGGGATFSGNPGCESVSAFIDLGSDLDLYPASVSNNAVRPLVDDNGCALDPERGLGLQVDQ